MNSPRILIAGITGFLGSRLAHELVASGNTSVLGLHRTNSNRERLTGISSKVELFNIEQQTLESLFRTHRIDIIVNCLADYGRKTSVEEGAEANLHLPTRLLELGEEHGVSVFLNAGTSLPAGVNDYSLTKNQFSERLREHSSKLVAVDAKLEHFYGAGESEERFISYLIKQFLKPVATLDLTKGEQRRDFLHVNDVVSAFGTLIEHGLRWRPGYYQIPVGSGEAYLLRNVVEQVRRLTGNQQTLVYYGVIPYRKNEVMVSRADTRMLEKLGWLPRFTLEEGLRQTIACYRNPPQGRKAS